MLARNLQCSWICIICQKKTWDVGFLLASEKWQIRRKVKSHSFDIEVVQLRVETRTGISDALC